MKILSVDTSSNVCSVAIMEDDKCIVENSINDGKTHSENLMPLIEKTLQDNNVKLNSIELIAVVVGPGSFTGIRIGVASVKAIAEVLSVPIVAVTSLEGLAYNIKNVDENICALIDARNNQVYAGIFDDMHNPLEEYMADDINNVLEQIKKYNNITFVGDGAVMHKELIQSKIEKAKFVSDDKNVQSAKSVGEAGYSKYKMGIIENADTIIPKYLRKSQAERMKK